MMIPLLLLTLVTTTVQVDIINVPLERGINAVLAPSGKAELRREGTVTRVKIEVERVQSPAVLGPALTTYSVWAVSAEGLFENLGELNINGNKGLIEATTRLGQLGILITAEPHYMVDLPSAAVAYRTQSPREDVRHRMTSIEVGVYDYSALKPVPPSTVHNYVLQARVAFQIAQNAGAERWAEMEFRDARVALTSMEELLTRSAPLEILWPTAAEAIRWSQRAVTIARGRNSAR
jgi:hypothetical protein